MTRGAVRRPTSRRGSVYIFVLAVSVLVATIGLAGLAAARVKIRTVALEQDWNEAALLAQSSVEHALMKIHDDPWWRYTMEAYEQDFTPTIDIGRGEIAWRLDDLSDNDLTDSDGDPVRVHGLGRVGESIRVLSAVAWPTGQPFDVLRTAIHAGEMLEVNATLDVRGGPASASGQIDVDGGLILGDAEADSVTTPANVAGTVAQPVPPKPVPGRALWDVYKAMATEIKFNDIFYFSGTSIHSVVLSPASNPFRPDQTDANGLYFVKVPYNTVLKIRSCRIEGTLLVELQEAAKLTIEHEVVWNPARPDFPALIVYTTQDWNTGVTIECSGELDEFLAGVNLNPFHTPYFGDADTTLDDTYPAALRGVFQVIRNVSGSPASRTEIIAPRRISGCIIADGDVRVNAASIVAADPWLLATPPLGYTQAPAPTTVLVNGDMESGLAGWSPVGGSTELRSEGGAHTGGKRITVKNRSTAADGIRQDVTGQMVSGATFVTNVWLNMNDDPEDVEIALEIDSTGEGTQRFTVVVPAIGTSWSLATVQHTPTWTGTLVSGRWVVSTTTTTQEVRIDDASLEPLSDDHPPRLSVIPGTWRAEAVTP